MLPCLLLACLALLGGCADDPAPQGRATLTSEATAALREDFASGDRERIDRALERIGAAEPPVAWLLEGLQHADRGVREWSAHALGDLAANGESSARTEGVVGALVIAFEDKDDYVRWKAARALGHAGPHARIALPLLEAAAVATREVEVVRASSQRALEQLRALDEAGE